MLFVWCVWSALAWAGVPDDLALAANGDAPQAVRMEAFDRMVAEGATTISHVVQVAQTPGGDARQRWVAARVLGKVGGARAQETLVALMSDDMPAMRAAAVQALGDLGDRSVSAAVAQRLEDPAILVRAGAAEALGKLGDPETVDALDKALASRDNYYRDSSLWVRRHYVAALGQIGSERAIPALMRCLDDADPGVVAEAILSFEQVAGFSYGDGRELDEQREAWRRWSQARLR